MTWSFSQERQGLWLSKDDLNDPSSWSSPPLVLLRDIHDGLLDKYDYKDKDPPPTQPGTRTRLEHDSQDGASQKEVDPLFLPHIDRLYETSSWGEDTSNIVVIPLTTGSHSKSSNGDSRLKTFGRDFRSRVALTSFTFTHRNV